MSAQSYSQHGEDVFIERLLNESDGTVFVDVGANDGQSWSNSYFFGRKGFKLILVEPMSVYAQRCRELYNGNINVFVEECAVAATVGKTTFYINDDAETDLLAMRSSLHKDIIPSAKISEVHVLTSPLDHILRKYSVPHRYAVLSVDAEGNDLDVLKTASLDIRRPRVVCVEEGINSREIHDLLAGHSYKLVTTLGPNGIYLSEIA